MSSDGLQAGEPARVSRYSVLRRIGEGGMSTVYRAYDPELDRQVALELLSNWDDSDPDGPARLVREARAMAKISHPNVAAVYDVGLIDGAVFIAMELIGGSDPSAARPSSRSPARSSRGAWTGCRPRPTCRGGSPTCSSAGSRRPRSSATLRCARCWPRSCSASRSSTALAEQVGARSPIPFRPARVGDKVPRVCPEPAAQGEPQIGEMQLENIELPSGTLITQSKTYKIVGRLGEGGFGKVYKVFDPIMNRYAALKMMKMNVPEEERRRFRQEARLCGTFMHPNLIRTLEVGTTKDHGLFWFAMEYLDGSDLLGYLNRSQRLTFPQLREVFTQTLDGLTHVHARRFVHCDIKPANIFVATDLYDSNLRLVKLIDFGVARDLADDSPPPSRRIMGDPFYMPPEQTYSNPTLDARSDLYALGVTFYEMVTGGRHPYEDLFEQHPREALIAQRERVPQAPSSFLGDVHPEHASDVDGFIATAMAKDPDERFPSAEIMKRALQHVVGPDGV